MKTERKAASGTMLTLLLIGMLASALNIQPASGSGTIYIRADGSINPSTAPISTIDNVTYTFTNNIYDSIVIERDNIVIEGASYTLQGTGTPPSEGINLSGRENVTIQNTQIKNFWNGIYFNGSSNNIVSANNITANKYNGIMLHSSYNNSVYHNNFIDNNHQVHDQAWNNPEVSPSIYVWDNGYLSGGNYWSDCTGEDANSDGINDTPYAIDENNQDNYPLMNPWTPIEETSPLWTQWWFWTIIAAAVAVSAGALYLLRKREPPASPPAHANYSTGQKCASALLLV